MATFESDILMQTEDASGNRHIHYPITRAENVITGEDETLDQTLQNLSASKSVPLDGSKPMSGTLIMKKVEGQGQGEWYKNHDADSDLGTVVSDKDVDGNVAQLVARAKTQQVFAKFSDSELDPKELFGEHNPDVARQAIHSFYNLSEIGVTEGEETIESIARGLPTYSRLVITIGGSNNVSIYPNSNYGLLIVEKTVASRIMFTFINNQGVRWSGVYVISSSSGNTWTEWLQIYDSKYITYGAADLVAGSTALPNGRLHFVYE